MLNLRNVAEDEGLQAADGVVLFLFQNEARMVLAFYDVANEQSLGVFYAGEDNTAAPVSSPTFTDVGYAATVLWTKLAPRRMWRGVMGPGVVIMGNGFDPNLTFECDTQMIRKMGDGIRPLDPVVAGVDVVDTTPITASLTAGNVTFYALEASFRPIGEESPYKRERGNHVSVSVERVVGTGFSSLALGSGTLASPFIYRLFCPQVEAGEQALVEFVKRDLNAHGLISAQINAASAGISYFPETPLSGGRSALAKDDVFPGPYQAVCLTYVRVLADGTTQETMPSTIATTQRFEKGRVSVTITRDTVSALAALYGFIRVYVADCADKAFRLYPEDYGAFKLGAEVPNVDGVVTISPSMCASDVTANIEARPPPPCDSFLFAQNRIVLTGNPDFPRRAWFTKEITKDERLPEGVGLFSWRDYPGQVISDRTVALGTYRGEAVIFTKTTAWPLFDSPRRYNLLAGAVSSGGVITWAGGELLFLGRDGMIYNLTQPASDASATAPDCDLAVPAAEDYVARHADLRDGAAIHSVVDALTKSWWLWLRGVKGNMQAFQLRLDTKQLTGPFDFPQLVASSRVDEGDPRVIGCDLAGNLFVLDLESRTNLQERFSGSAALVLHPGTDSSDASIDGFGAAVINVAGSNRYVKKAHVMRLQTGWLNVGAVESWKGIYAVQFQTIQGSAGFVSIIIFNDRGKSVRRVYGEVFGKQQPHRVLFRLPGSMLQVFVLVVVGDDQPFAIRNLTFEPDGLGVY